MFGANKPKLEGPALPFIGSAVGAWLGTGTAVGAIGGSIIGGLAATALAGSMTKTPSYPTSQLPGAPTPPQIPNTEIPTVGSATPATAADLAKGELETAKRRGRVATILSSQRNNPDTEVERLGG